MAGQTIKSIITSQYTKEGVKKLLSEVDDLVLKKKTEKNPEKLLKDKKEVLIMIQKVRSKVQLVKEQSLKLRSALNNLKEKFLLSKETTEEFLKSFQLIIFLKIY